MTRLPLRVRRRRVETQGVTNTRTGHVAVASTRTGARNRVGNHIVRDLRRIIRIATTGVTHLDGEMIVATGAIVSVAIGRGERCVGTDRARGRGTDVAEATRGIDTDRRGRERGHVLDRGRVKCEGRGAEATSDEDTAVHTGVRDRDAERTLRTDN